LFLRKKAFRLIYRRGMKFTISRFSVSRKKVFFIRDVEKSRTGSKIARRRSENDGSRPHFSLF